MWALLRLRWLRVVAVVMERRSAVVVKEEKLVVEVQLVVEVRVWEARWV